MKIKLNFSGSNCFFLKFFILLYEKFYFSYFFINSDKFSRKKIKFNFLKKFFILNNFLYFQFINLFIYNNLNFFNNYLFSKIIKIKLFKFLIFNYGFFFSNFFLLKKKLLNIHSSVLPLWLGPDPIKYSLKFFNNYSGLSFINLNKYIDKGKINLNFKFKLFFYINLEYYKFKINLISSLVFKKYLFLNIIKNYFFSINQLKFYIFYSKKNIKFKD